MQQRDEYTVCTWDDNHQDWPNAGVGEGLTLAEARGLAETIARTQRKSARVLHAWTYETLAQFYWDGSEMTLAEIAEWDDADEEPTDEERRERREEFDADQAFNISREQGS